MANEGSFSGNRNVKQKWRIVSNKSDYTPPGLLEGGVRVSRKLNVESHFESEADLRRYEALLEMADLMVHHHDLPELFLAMAERLRQIVAADAANFSLYDPIKNVMRLHLWVAR
jgi:hypothetical protein